MTVIEKTDFPGIVEIYNRDGRRATYEYIRQKFGLKKPYFVIQRLIEKSDYIYDKGKDKFELKDTGKGDELFMSLDELCRDDPGETHVTSKERAAASMEKLVQELISDRLLELSRYITLESSSHTIIIDRTSMKNDGYCVVVH